jgi:hypothetical protein
MNLTRLIDRFQKILPSIVYNSSDTVAWDNEYQRTTVARQAAIQALEERIRELELVRGKDVYIYQNGKKNMTVEERIEELRGFIKKIKEL